MFFLCQYRAESFGGHTFGFYDTLTEVCFTGTPTCATESDYDNHSRTEKTVLTFHSVEVLPIRRQLAFIVTDAQGNSYVIGHAEDPFPTVKVTHSHGTPAEEKAGFTYEVKLIGRKTHVVTGIMRMFAFFCCSFVTFEDFCTP